MPSLVSPRVARATHDGARVEVAGERGERLRVCALGESIFRVTHEPEGAPRLARTWSVVGELQDAPRAGRVRDEYDGAFPDAPAGVAAVHADTASVETSKLRAEVDASVGGHLGVSFHDVALGARFAGDRQHGSYLYDAAPGGALVRHYMQAEPGERLFGFGEPSGALDKAGRRLRVGATDAMGYDARSSDPLYKHWPAFVVVTPCASAEGGVLAYGVLYDNLARGAIDLGAEISAFRGGYRYAEFEAGDLDYYLVHGPAVVDVVERLSWLIGRAHPPPRYALGYLGSTMAYTEQPDAQAQLASFGALCEEHDIPCSAFHLSSGYTSDAAGRRCVFTWNASRVPEPAAMFAAFHARSMRVLPNIKPWLLVCHPEYARLDRAGGLLKVPGGGKTLVGRFWSGGAGVSGEGSYVDFASTAGYDWWVEQLTESLIALGADGAWNDNNEYEVDDDAAACGDPGKYEAVGLFGRARFALLMARASRDALLAARPDRRPFVISRSGCMGTQRYAQQTWSGDNYTGWDTLAYNIPMGLSLGMVGWPGGGHDVGAFAGPRPEPELFVRWVQQGVMQPRFVIHSGLTTDGSCNEPWMFPEATPAVRAAIYLRYRLVPYLHSLHLAAYLHGRPVARALPLHFASDPAALGESMLYTLGASLLVATVLKPLAELDAEPGAEGRVWPVCLPRGNGVERWCDVESGEWHAAGTTVRRPVTLDSMPLFAAERSCVPIELGLAAGDRGYCRPLAPVAVDASAGGPSAAEIAAVAAGDRSVRGARRAIVVFPPPDLVGSFECTLYDDDGVSSGYARGEYAEIVVAVAAEAAEIRVSLTWSGGYAPPYPEVLVMLPPADARTLVGGGAEALVRLERGEDGSRAQAGPCVGLSRTAAV